MSSNKLHKFSQNLKLLIKLYIIYIFGLANAINNYLMLKIRVVCLGNFLTLNDY